MPFMWTGRSISATISIADGSIATDQLFVNLTDDGSGHFITSDGETTSIAGAEQCIRHLDAGGSGLAACRRYPLER
jgi:hypothetical protein